MTRPDQPLYVCGHTPRELERLELQGTLYRDITRAFLERAGLAPGMRVLDVGCGVGGRSLTHGSFLKERA